MKTIVDAIVAELKDKNACLDTVKMFARVAIKSSKEEFTEVERIAIVTECLKQIPFDPLGEVF